ncbi:type I 3-dehydroquinate dehydratase [Niallia nealsonii]|uniref:3-dehydroquinate dehydratase n=1 Tax=Niallia nealsonii TaxID=115979 RepID=A0A2N0Z211_9BACI|nr:type I 3-dehydroquinate dehydratase [Niallia nealsonii]PKG23544.1 type I 3-dehydroquinate dehydratase [Niallia nealsonii]
MGKLVKVKDIVIGEGMPKICVSLIGQTMEQLKEEAALLKTSNVDIIEWRVDFFEHIDSEMVIQALYEIRKVIPDKPLIFTFRSAKEGGERELETASYFALNGAIVETGMADIIDIELLQEEASIKELVEFAHNKKVAVIISNHEFKQTPPKEEIIKRLIKAQSLGADLPKMAVMPKNAEDVITLLDATNTMKKQYANGPIITMAMAGTGSISRMAGELFGSDVTFAAAKKASAPGQIPVDQLKKVLEILHHSL